MADTARHGRASLTPVVPGAAPLAQAVLAVPPLTPPCRPMAHSSSLRVTLQRGNTELVESLELKKPFEMIKSKLRPSNTVPAILYGGVKTFLLRAAPYREE